MIKNKKIKLHFPYHLRWCDYCCCFSVARACLTLCKPMKLQHTRLPYPSPSPGPCSHSCPLSQWCHPTISSAVIPFFSWLLSFAASESFLMSLLFHIRWPKYWSFSFCISPSNKYSRLIPFRTEWFDLLAPRDSRVFSNSVQKHQFFSAQPYLWFNSHINIWLLEKPYVWLHGPWSAK